MQTGFPMDTLCKKLVDAFLQRHGFADLNDSRDMSSLYQVVRIERASPIQIAEELGNEAMVKMLTEAQAQADRTGGAFGLDFHLDTHTLGKSRRRGYAFSEGN
jgi:hypothetical protein